MEGSELFSFNRLMLYPFKLLARSVGEAGLEPAIRSSACDFRSIAWHKKKALREWSEVVLQFLAVAFTIWLHPLRDGRNRTCMFACNFGPIA